LTESFRAAAQGATLLTYYFDLAWRSCRRSKALTALVVLLWLLGQLAVLGPARRAAAVPPVEATRSA
jgi:ABC-type lipoprotein release transport system permease subunit